MSSRLKILSWNVNGIRAIAKKQSLRDMFKQFDADIVCIQETRISGREQITPDLAFIDDEYDSFWSICTNRKGYSGVVTYCKRPQMNNNNNNNAAATTTKSWLPVDAWEGIGNNDDEGRCVVTDHGKFVLFNCYLPNSYKARERLDYKLAYYRHFQKRLESMVLQENRHVLVIGDLNTPHMPIDIYESSRGQDGPSGCFNDEERAFLDNLFGYTSNNNQLDDASSASVPTATTNSNKSLFVDTFRYFHPDRKGAYTYWVPYIGRKGNYGWRLDYAIADRELCTRHIVKSDLLQDIMGSDHCPIFVEMQFDDEAGMQQQQQQQQQQEMTEPAPVSEHYKGVAARYFCIPKTEEDATAKTTTKERKPRAPRAKKPEPATVSVVDEDQESSETVVIATTANDANSTTTTITTSTTTTTTTAVIVERTRRRRRKSQQQADNTISAAAAAANDQQHHEQPVGAPKKRGRKSASTTTSTSAAAAAATNPANSADSMNASEADQQPTDHQN